MEGDKHLPMKKNRVAGKCPVLRCRCYSRPKGKLCSKHSTQLWRIKHPVKAAFSNSRHHAKQRGIEWGMTLEEYSSIVDLQRYIDGKGVARMCLQLDRKDHTRGYFLDNIQVITCGENTAKGNSERRRGYVQQKIDSYDIPF